MFPEVKKVVKKKEETLVKRRSIDNKSRPITQDTSPANMRSRDRLPRYFCTSRRDILQPCKRRRSKDQRRYTQEEIDLQYEEFLRVRNKNYVYDVYDLDDNDTDALNEKQETSATTSSSASPSLLLLQTLVLSALVETNYIEKTNEEISGNTSSSLYLVHRDLVIGKGSFGRVCIASEAEAEGHHSGRSCKRKKFACKCVMLRNDPRYITKLQKEIDFLRELRGHENIIRLHDVFCVDNELFIITELGRGGDLFHLLITHPRHGFTEAYAAKTVAEMLSAVAFLHSRYICHRDLKLENWVLESGKNIWSPLKLIDFGLSTYFTPGQRLSRFVGSSYYVAPEVLKKSYTEACDLWSLGVIVYMLLSGGPPFYGENDEIIKASIVQGEYTFPYQRFHDVSDEALDFVSSLLSYEFQYRCTAENALTHAWLACNCNPEVLQKAKDGARGIGITQKIVGRMEPIM